jgi:membrane-associated phospholipid phosphatase
VKAANDWKDYVQSLSLRSIFPALTWRTLLRWLSGIGFLLLTLWSASGRYLPGEQGLLLAIVNNRIAELNQPALLISALGSINVILPLWIVIMAAAALGRRLGSALQLLVAPLGYPIYVAIKSWVGRPGPVPPLYPWLYDLPLGYLTEGLLRRQAEALPTEGLAVPVVPQPVTAQTVTRVMESGYVSGHALVAAIFYGSLALFLWRNGASHFARWFGAVFCAILAVSVGVARVYMGVHFPSDVIGAWLLAILFLSLIDETIKRILPRLSLARQPVQNKKRG